MPRDPVKKHDRDNKVQERVREFANRDFQDWTSCEMYGHEWDGGRCSDCGEPRDTQFDD